MEAEQEPRGLGLAELLKELRRRKGFTKQSLAEASEVSATYIGQIESSIDPRTGKPYQPSPPKLRMLAGALGRGDAREADRIYRLLMEAAGYLPEDMAAAFAPPPPSVVVLAPGAEPETAAHWVSEPIPTWPHPHRPPRARNPQPAGPTVELPDPRLEAHLRPLLENWGWLTSGEQAAILEFVEYVDQKRRRRQGEAEGGH